MDDKKQWFREGVENLIRNIKSIDYHRNEFLFAVREAMKEGRGPRDTLTLPERTEWNQFRDDICAELKAAVRIASEDFNSELLNCRKLAIALSEGFYQDGSPLIFECIVELSAFADQLSKGERIFLVPNGISIGDEVVALTSKQQAMVQLMYEHPGEYVSLAEHGYRTRDTESLPPQVKKIIESQPGAGTRINPEWFN